MNRRSGSSPAAKASYELRRRSEPTSAELMMECEEEALSASQIEAAQKATVEYENVVRSGSVVESWPRICEIGIRSLFVSFLRP